jgi:integrase
MNRHERKRRRRRSRPTTVKVGNAAVKIYAGKSRGYDLFTLVHYAGGQRKRETFAKLDEAKRRGREVARAMLNGRLAVLELTSADREGYVSALELLEPFAVPLHSAVQEYVAARSHLLEGESLLSAVKEHAARRRHVVQKSVAEIVEEILAAKKNDGLSNRYIETLRNHLERFRNAFQTNIGSITAAMIEDWLLAQKVGARTRNNLRTSLLTLFRFARSRGHLPKGQPTEVDDVRRAKDRGGKIGILMPKQLAELIYKAPADIKLYLAIGAFTGMRASEILRLTWDEVNFERGHITVAADKAKTATRRLVPILPNLGQWLAPYRGAKGKVVAPRIDSRAIEFAKKRRVVWPNNCLRHSFASYRLAATADVARTSLELGNSPAKLFGHYRELVSPDEAIAWFQIGPKRAKNVVQIAAA